MTALQTTCLRCCWDSPVAEILLTVLDWSSMIVSTERVHCSTMFRLRLIGVEAEYAALHCYWSHIFMLKAAYLIISSR